MPSRAPKLIVTSGILCIGLSSAIIPALAVMPLPTVPSWESTPLGHIATGGAFTDVDGDGWLDMVVANGNDISLQRCVVYHNQGNGTFPLTPTWTAGESDYHGHLDIGDINGDGLPDLAVAVYLGPLGFGFPGRVKVYLNTGNGVFSTAPDWTPGMNFFCFSVALGDADGDGDLDLACATGEDYENYPERKLIFFNDNGTLERTPSWMSDEIGYALDVAWWDVDDDGDMDLAFCGSSTPMRIYRNDQTAGGGITTTAAWENTDLPQYGNTTMWGDWNGDGFPELAVADNRQLGGAGRFKVYGNVGGTLGTAPVWTSSTGGNGSHVSWIDLDLDGDPDLAAGRWFAQGYIYENVGATLTPAPVWTSSTNSVIENMFWGDVDNDGLRSDGVTMATGDGVRTFFALGHSPVHRIDEVRIDGTPVTTYVAHPANGWISLAPPPGAGSAVEIDYTYSTDVDLGVTNWDSIVGNYLFLNTGSAVAVPDVASALSELRAVPNPMRARTRIRYRGDGVPAARVSVLDVTGRLVRTLHDGPIDGGLWNWEWDGRDGAGRPVAAGVYYARMETGARERSLRLVVVR